MTGAGRVAALYDVHGNLPALEAVLDEVRRESVDRVVVGGDVLPGPMPVQALARLLELDLPVELIRGNGEREVLAVAAGAEPTVAEEHRPAIRWVAAQLGPEHRRSIAGWPGCVRIGVEGLGDVLFCHATPGSDSEIFTRLTPEHRLLDRFRDVDAGLVVCGHTHMQFDRRIGGVRVVNAGSVGMPFGEPGTYWLLLGSEVELRHTRYDLEAAAKRIRATEYPQAEAFAAHNVLSPPTEEEMLKLLSRAAI